MRFVLAYLIISLTTSILGAICQGLCITSFTATSRAPDTYMFCFCFFR